MRLWAGRRCGLSDGGVRFSEDDLILLFVDDSSYERNNAFGVEVSGIDQSDDTGKVGDKGATPGVSKAADGR